MQGSSPPLLVKQKRVNLDLQTFSVSIFKTGPILKNGDDLAELFDPSLSSSKGAADEAAEAEQVSSQQDIHIFRLKRTKKDANWRSIFYFYCTSIIH